MLSVRLETDRLGGTTVSLMEDIAIATDQEVRNHLPALADNVILRVRDSHEVIPETGDLGISVAPG